MHVASSGPTLSRPLSGGRDGSLLHAIDKTATGAGARLLTARLSSPSTDPSEIAARTHFVSITLDPERDDPAALLAYASVRKLDLSNWSFLTGEADAIDAVLRAYGVGRVPVEGGDIQHTVATFLIDAEGEIRERYLGSGTDAATLRRDLEALL